MGVGIGMVGLVVVVVVEAEALRGLVEEINLRLEGKILEICGYKEDDFVVVLVVGV